MGPRAPIPMLVAALALVLAHPSFGQDWPRFRGPNGAGQSGATTVPVRWTTSDYNWRVKLPGAGNSSPVVRGDRLFITAARQEDATRIIRCLSTADGRLIWKRDFPSSAHPKNDFNTYADSTPALDEDRVYLTWATPKEYIVLALDQAKGREIWRRDLGPFVAQHGFGASPILFEDTLIVTADQHGPGFVMALDRASGKTRWKADRRGKTAAYSTPCIYRREGGPPQLILTSTANGLSSLDPRTGKLNWELDVLQARCVASPTVVAGLIFVNAGVGGGGKQMVAVRPGDPGNAAHATVAYELKGSLPYVPTSVACGDLLFLLADSGVVTCLDAPSGAIHWRERIGGNFFASPVRVADRLYCVSRDGKMVVLAAARQFKLLARINLEEPSDSTPTVARGVMYLRTRAHLMAIGGKPRRLPHR